MRQCENAADCSDEGALAKSVIFARAVRLLKSITSLVILSGAKRSNRRQKSRRFRQQVAMGIRPYAADCGALVLPLASKVKLRAPSKDLYKNKDDICIEIPRQARDDRGEAAPSCHPERSRAGRVALRSRTGLCPAARGGEESAMQKSGEANV